VTVPDAAKWAGIPSERRWAMEVLGLGAGMKVDRTDIQKRFRRLLRTAHPDHGGESVGAAERIAELTEARELLLAGIAKPTARAANGNGNGQDDDGRDTDRAERASTSG
jgi:DnaJ-class molecular chaperone